jgi:DNA polymerase V
MMNNNDENLQNDQGITLNRKKLSNAVKEKRLQEGLTLRELEDVVGAGFATLSRIESGIGSPDSEHLVSICQWLRRPPESFFSGVSSPLRARTHHKTKVNAGLPPPNLEDIENIEYVDLCEYLMPDQDDYFTVTVKGDSMIGAQIYDGDLLIARKAIEANSGDIVIAAIDRKYCAKVFDRSGRSISLLSANSRYDPIPVEEVSQFRILGIVEYSVHRQQGSSYVIP